MAKYWRINFTKHIMIGDRCEVSALDIPYLSASLPDCHDFFFYFVLNGEDIFISTQFIESVFTFEKEDEE